MRLRVFEHWVEEEYFGFEELDDDSPENGEILEIPDEIVNKLLAARKAESQAYSEFYSAVYEARDNKAFNKKIQELRELDDKEKVARSEKTSFLKKQGWEQINISLFRKGDVELKMHEAFIRALNEVLK